MIQRLAGIHERRWWDEGTTFADGAAMAGAKAMAEAGVNPAAIGLMVNTSVSRAHVEPSTAVGVHAALGLPSSCLNFDITNACLGFVNGMQLAASLIDSGQIDYALVVNGEMPARSTRPPSPGCSPATTMPVRCTSSSPPSPWGRVRRPWCSAAVTDIRRDTGSWVGPPAPGPSTIGSASGTWTTCAPTAPA